MHKAVRICLYVLLGVVIFVVVFPVSYYLMNQDSYESDNNAKKMSYYDMGYIDGWRLDVGEQISPILQIHGYVKHYDKFGCVLYDDFKIPKGYGKYMEGLKDGLKERLFAGPFRDYWHGSIQMGKLKAVNCEWTMSTWEDKMKYYNSSLFQ